MSEFYDEEEDAVKGKLKLVSLPTNTNESVEKA
jgi:hypothetical protein